jgi:hypothetical protein
LAFAEVAAAALPEAFAFAADDFAADLPAPGRAGAFALPLGLPAALLGMSFPIRRTSGVGSHRRSMGALRRVQGVKFGEPYH